MTLHHFDFFELTFFIPLHHVLQRRLVHDHVRLQRGPRRRRHLHRGRVKDLSLAVAVAVAVAVPVPLATSSRVFHVRVRLARPPDPDVHRVDDRIRDHLLARYFPSSSRCTHSRGKLKLRLKRGRVRLRRERQKQKHGKEHRQEIQSECRMQLTGVERQLKRVPAE
jgi:hypothetical protein